MNKQIILRDKFGYSSFRPGQEEVIDSILGGTDVLAVMPTGAGKSLCYQIPALLLDGITIVISPLISLMKDQVSALREAVCCAAFLNSSLTGGEYVSTMNAITGGSVKLLYIAPERLQKTEMINFAADYTIPLVVVDEAHCVSQWGHDFRTSYLQITNYIKNIKTRPVVAAFTATATVKVRDDIKKFLSLRGPFVINTGFDRPNLYFEVQKPKDKKAALLECLEKRKKSSGIIYCATRKTADETCQWLIRRGFDATRYHAGLDDNERKRNQDDFIYDRKPVMVATNAFGMGIDKSNVSFVIHYNMPKNIESYYQEAGRAGRDGAPADCILLYNGQDVRINQYLITHNEEEETVNETLVAHNLELLKQMTFYAMSGNCLRHRLLAYFGESAPASCGHCSICLTEYDETDITLDAKKIVSCVYRLKQRNRNFGKTMIIDILRGSKNEKIIRCGLDTLSTWGLMSDTGALRIRLILDHLIDEGLLILQDSEYPVVILGEAGALLRDEQRIFMKLPQEQKKSPKKIELHFSAEAASTKNYQTPSRQNEVIAEKSETNKTPTQKKPLDIDEALLDKLRKLRKDIASGESVPAYIVFSDANLHDMCRKMPVSLAEFSGVNGVGRIKLEKYGKAFISLIREYINDTQ